MTIGKYLSGGAIAALAAALALAATPAAAREENGRNWRNHQASSDSRTRNQVREARRDNVRTPPAARPQAQRSQTVRQAPQARPQATNRAQFAERDRERVNNRAERKWQSRNENRRPENVRVPPSARSAQTAERNRTYADRDRNRTYTDRDRSRSYDGRRDRTENRDGYRDGRRADRRDDRRADRYAYNSGRRDGYRDARRDYRRWDRHDWRRDRRYDWRYDWRVYRNSHRSTYRLGRYYAPYSNYYYRRLSIGFFLDSLFFSSRYWINDPWNYRLPAVYGPYRWVRYYDDALLVDTYSGEVVDVIYDFFW